MLHGKKLEQMTPHERVNLIDSEFPFCVDILKVIGSFLAETDSTKWDVRHEEALSNMLSSVGIKLARIKELVDFNNAQLLDFVEKEGTVEKENLPEE
jgi:hypothetical protein